MARKPLVLLLATLLLAGGAVAGYRWWSGRDAVAAPGKAETAAAAPGKPFVPNAAQLASFTVVAAAERDFQPEQNTDGKIGSDEERTTPVFSPYAGRVTRLIARQGQTVAAGDVLFTLQATDMVQAQTDVVAANGVLNKARSQLGLAQTVEKRQRELYDSKAVALRDWQAAQNDLVGAQNDLRAAEGALDAVRNRLVILGKSEAEIATFLDKGRISPETPIVTPIGGTVIARRVGPGQFVGGGAGDPPYTVGDLSRVWLLAQVREADAPLVKVGQPVRFRVLAVPDRVFSATLAYVGAAIDPTTRRVTVRAEIANDDGVLKPEMFASVTIAVGPAQRSPAVPREAVIYEGDRARVWVLRPDGAVELRRVTTGLVAGADIQIASGLAVGEKVVSRGSLFIDRLATGDAS